MTEAGLNTINLSTLNRFQQITLFALIIIGSSIWVSISVVHVRKKAFERRFIHLESQSSSLRDGLCAQSRVNQNDIATNAQNLSHAFVPDSINHHQHIKFSDQLPKPVRQRLPISKTRRFWNFVEDRVRFKSPSKQSTASKPFSHPLFVGIMNTFSESHHIPNSTREKLGGVEYKAVVFLSWIVPLYFVTWQILGSIAMGAQVACKYSNITRENGINPWWVGAFMAVSAFNNSGMSLLDLNMIPFARDPFILLSMGLFILAGNSCYPIFLRLFIWSILKLLPRTEKWQDRRYTLQFLLDHPRRCYTNLFPSRHTWWLFVAVLVLNGIDTIMYPVLNIGNEDINSAGPGYEFLAALFQAVAVRNGGFYVVPIPNLRIGLQVLYVIMMYISVYPITISIRNSNVYEERSLGIFIDDPEYESEQRKYELSASHPFNWFRQKNITKSMKEQSRLFFIQQQLKSQLAHDLWVLALGVFLIMVIEGSSFEVNPIEFSVFNVLFEVVSAYGNVGISVGVPNDNYSFSGALRTLSKLILCAVMIKGRHRGLPVAIDKAVQLPSENANDSDDEELENISRHRITRQTDPGNE